MAFSLIDDTTGVTPVVVLTKDRLSAWLAEAPERERTWLTVTGFSADKGKPALVPADNGRIARVVVGLGESTDGGTAMWALAGLPEALPEGSYRLETAPDEADPTRLALGWALATYAFTRYRAKKSAATALVSQGRRSRPRRAARPRGVSRSRPREHAGRRPRAIGARRRGRARRQSRRGQASRHRRRRTPRRELPDDPRRRPRRGPGTAPRRHPLGRARGTQGDPGRQRSVLRHWWARSQDRLGHAADEEGHGGSGDHPRPRPGDHGRELWGPPARAAAGRRERRLGQRCAPDGHRPHPQGADCRDRQHRCRRPADPMRRSRRSGNRKAGAARRHGDADGGGTGGARPAAGGTLL